VTTLTIPLTTLPVGPLNFGPSNVADAESHIVLSIDRTVPGGLNSLTAASQIETDIQQSNDGGATWFFISGGAITGGVFIDKHGATLGTAQQYTDLLPGTSRRLRASCNVLGTPIAVAGTLVTS
jgi:hypothetical protein